MTEAEWRTCRDPRAMLRALFNSWGELQRKPGAGPSCAFVVSDEKQQQIAAAFSSGRPPKGHPPEDRKFLLFVAACCRRIEHLFLPEQRDILDLHERDADNALHTKERATADRRQNKVARLPAPADRTPILHEAVTGVISCLLLGGHDTNPDAVFDAINEALLHDPGDADPDEGPHQAALLRDIYGTPYKPLRFDPAWRTDTAVTLARTMYEAREFSAMPILADALQDAGCDNDDILNHCRDAQQVHVRGCWVVDLVLGKA
jgi:hypothetical protein